uniref:probable G-protein coupled receptor 160 isoform X3 n=1 Tax=Panthera onca TaxID=9690 RepID=UPI00295324E5|nr:probable G-protein coupled receptor 160 isoform X3 [Panthera onca]
MSLSGEWLQLSPFSTPLPRIRGGGFHRLSPPHRQAAPLRPASRRGRDGACVFKVGPPRTPALPGARRLACRSWGFGPDSLPPPSSFERSGRSRAGARGSRPSLGGHLGPGAAGVWSGTQRRERGAHAGNRCTLGGPGRRRPGPTPEFRRRPPGPSPRRKVLRGNRLAPPHLLQKTRGSARLP